MNILWLTNIKPHIISRLLDEKENIYGGWLDNLSSRLIQDNYVTFLFPSNRYESNYFKNCEYHSFIDNDKVGLFFYSILKNKTYDIINIWGSEYKYSYILFDVSKKFNIKNIVLSIQGLVSEIAKVYDSYLDPKTLNSNSFHDFLKKSNMIMQKKDFINNGKYEINLINQIKHIVGRTDWDQNIIKNINPNAKYYRLNDSLRDVFYLYPKWNYSLCSKHSIFVSQAQYPIKGFHLLLKAIKFIKEKYNDVMVYVAGRDVFKTKFYRISSYEAYIKKTIIQYNLINNIKYLGLLNKNEIKNILLKSNIFISPSTIENESNSMCEAMLTGTPIIASNVGGISSILRDKIDGFLYKPDDINHLIKIINYIFLNEKKIESIINSKNVTKRANALFNQKNNYNNLINIYKKIMNST